MHAAQRTAVDGCIRSLLSAPQACINAVSCTSTSVLVMFVMIWSGSGMLRVASLRKAFHSLTYWFPTIPFKCTTASHKLYRHLYNHTL